MSGAILERYGKLRILRFANCTVENAATFLFNIPLDDRPRQNEAGYTTREIMIGNGSTILTKNILNSSIYTITYNSNDGSGLPKRLYFEIGYTSVDTGEYKNLRIMHDYGHPASNYTQWQDNNMKTCILYFELVYFTY